jgi:hypothetical protein
VSSHSFNLFHPFRCHLPSPSLKSRSHNSSLHLTQTILLNTRTRRSAIPITAHRRVLGASNYCCFVTALPALPCTYHELNIRLGHKRTAQHHARRADFSPSRLLASALGRVSCNRCERGNKRLLLCFALLGSGFGSSIYCWAHSKTRLARAPLSYLSATQVQIGLLPHLSCSTSQPRRTELTSLRTLETPTNPASLEGFTHHQTT